MRDIIVFESKEAFSRDAAYRFSALAARKEWQNDPFRVALTGGSSPVELYRQLACIPFVDTIAWDNVELYFGDERAVPVDSDDSNFKQAHTLLLSHLPIPDSNIFRIQGELPPEEAAQRYEADLREGFALAAGELPGFDLILLGMGPDGHCASLFPHKPSLHVTDRLVVASEPGLAPFVPRITLTLSVLNAAANVFFMVEGTAKAERVAQILQGPPAPDDLPSQSVQPANGELLWLLDKGAASRLA